VEKVTATFGAMTAFTSTVAAEVFTQVVENGSVETTIQAKRKLVRANRRAAERALGDHDIRGAEGSPHIWLQLPKALDVRELADRARNRGISIAPASAFAVDRSTAPNAARISIASTTDAKQLESALRTLATLADDARFSTATVV
jgi:DNA-binding transcriptional MocR family regulator